MRRILLVGFLCFMFWGCNPEKRLEEATLFLTILTLLVAGVACGIAIIAILGFGFVKEAFAFYDKHITDFARILFYDENSPFYDAIVRRPLRSRTPQELEALLRKIREVRTGLAVEAISNPIAESYKKILMYHYGDEVFALISQTYNALTNYREGVVSLEEVGEVNSYICERAGQFLELTQTMKQRPFSLIACSFHYMVYEVDVLWHWKISRKQGKGTYPEEPTDHTYCSTVPITPDTPDSSLASTNVPPWRSIRRAP